MEHYEPISRLWKELDESQVDIAPDRVKHYTGFARPEDFVEERITGNDRVMYLAILDEKAVGFVELHIVEVEEWNMVIARRYAHLGNIFVTASSRGKGVAKRLMLKATEWSLQNQATKIELQVYSNNSAASTMYANLGYRPFMQKLEIEL